jgi:signal transduction histidine kinase
LLDRALLVRAVENLVTNALKHGYPSDAAERPVRVRVSSSDAEVAIEVRDEGRGIPPAEQRRVFERFVRGRAAQATPGAGLGLAIVQSVAEAHGGRVELSSPPGAGCVFVLTLPAWSDSAAEEVA